MNNGSILCNHVDLVMRRTHFVQIDWHAGTITAIRILGEEQPGEPYLIPGFIDAHVHIESSMLPPSEFARLATRHGTIATVSDPHEIANVLGLEGVDYMLESAAQVPFHFFFGAPSCVPATPFETAGATLGLSEIEQLLDNPEIRYLSEMMNFPAVLNRDPKVMAKLALAKDRGLPIDGHAPGLIDEAASIYAAAGISTDHECFTLEEAQAKLTAGMKILIREGSAARNFNALHPLISSHTDSVMLCSDDKHPDDLALGHLNQLAALAVKRGHRVFDVLQCLCINPIDHYRLPLGRLQEGDPMDAALIADLQNFTVEATWLKGEKVAASGESLISSTTSKVINRFQAQPLHPDQLKISDPGEKMRVIEALDGELITHESLEEPVLNGDMAEPDPNRDLLLLCVYNRYQAAEPALGFIRGFGLRSGAIASSVAHDSHNIVAVGADRTALTQAINGIIESHGGIAVANSQGLHILPLPIAGLMSDADGDQVAQRYAQLDQLTKDLGSPLRAPFMTLSFMALLVIPELKLSDRGLFDGRSFQFSSLSVG